MQSSISFHKSKEHANPQTKELCWTCTRSALHNKIPRCEITMLSDQTGKTPLVSRITTMCNFMKQRSLTRNILTHRQPQTTIIFLRRCVLVRAIIFLLNEVINMLLKQDIFIKLWIPQSPSPIELWAITRVRWAESHFTTSAVQFDDCSFMQYDAEYEALSEA